MTTFDVFVSYALGDKSTADAACASLEANGIRCWIPPRDIHPGMSWARSIDAALNHCKVMILIFSSRANESPETMREVAQAIGNHTPVIPFRIEPVKPSLDMAYYLGALHWVDALTPPLEKHLDDLSMIVGGMLAKPAAARDAFGGSRADRAHEGGAWSTQRRPDPAPSSAENATLPRGLTLPLWVRNLASQRQSANPRTVGIRESKRFFYSISVWDVLRQDLAKLFSAVLAFLKRSGTPSSHVAADVVDISAFAPSRAAPGDNILVQVYLHKIEQGQEAKARATRADAEATERDTETLGTEIRRGQCIMIILEAAGVEIEDPAQSVVWRGLPTACRFNVPVPRDADGRIFSFRVRVLLDSVPIGKVSFKLPVMKGGDVENVRLVGDEARRYRVAFLSYSSPDRPEVLQCAQALQAAGIEFFQDIMSIRPGDRWEPKIFQQIDQCDLFLLFWSSHSAVSDWVKRETEYALERQRNSAPDEVPEIRPVILETPAPAPPDTLSHIHFNDNIRYVIAATRAQQQSPRS